nr:hypothetical protein [Cytophagales bacterium]
MIWSFQNKNEKILNEVVAFEGRLNQALVPLLQKPEKPVAGNGALMSMAVNMALHFLAVRNLKIFQKASVHIIAHAASTFGSMVAIGSEGKISVEDATNSILHEMHTTQADYSNALAKSSSSPEGALQECLNIFLDRSGGWVFKGEAERAEAVVLLSAELRNLMSGFKRIL